jgi:hypothetical protein
MLERWLTVRRMVAALVLLAAVVALAFSLLFGAGVLRYFQSIVYPNAAEVSGDTLYVWWPNPTVRRTLSLRTDDGFGKVFGWYSRTFDLGPEKHAIGQCSLMARSRDVLWLLEGDMSVQVCNTPAGRTVFVMRSLTFRWR